MTSMILTDDFAEEASDAARELLASVEQVLPLPKSKGCFVARKDAKLPVGAVVLREFEIDDVPVKLFTVI